MAFSGTFMAYDLSTCRTFRYAALPLVSIVIVLPYFVGVALESRSKLACVSCVVRCSF